MITLPKLGFDYNALEPYIDAKTMEIHHTKHHQAYIDKLNTVLGKYPRISKTSVEDLLINLRNLDIDESDKTIIRNHGGGHVNHSFFWTILNKSKMINQDLVDRIITSFGSVDTFKEKFNQAAVGHFGSGWVWLAENNQKALEIYSTVNQDSPYLKNHVPLIGLDVWEHAYYLKYQNRRAEYVTNWWQVLKLIPWIRFG